jgi:hypothetical protein
MFLNSAKLFKNFFENFQTKKKFKVFSNFNFFPFEGIFPQRKNSFPHIPCLPACHPNKPEGRQSSKRSDGAMSSLDQTKLEK